jgi:hypothetical protein
MTRAKSWQNNNGQVVTSEGWQPIVIDLGLVLTPGYTLLRNRVDVDILCQTFSDDSLPAAYPWPMLGWQTVVALCWSAEGPPDGYFATVFADWIFVQQVSFDLMPYTLHIDGNPNDQAYLRNCAESRTLDTKSMRDAEDGSTVYLVIDSTEWGSSDSSQWTPIVQWMSRTLILEPEL